MTKSIASYKPEQREAVVRRRLARPGHGNGYFAAQDAAPHFGIVARTGVKLTMRTNKDGTTSLHADHAHAFNKRFNKSKQPIRRRPPQPHTNRPTFKKAR